MRYWKDVSVGPIVKSIFHELKEYGLKIRNWRNVWLPILGVLIGIAGVLFGIHLCNLHVGIWGFSSGSFAALSLHLAILDKLGLVEKWYTPQMLSYIAKFGLVVQVAGLAGTITYIVLTIVSHHGKSLKAGFYITAGGALLTFVWGLYLSIYAWRLKVAMERRHASLLRGVRAYPNV